MKKESNREKEWKSTVKASEQNKSISLDDDINNLNSDDSFRPIDEQEEKVPLTEEEKREVRKKLFVLLVLIVVVLIFMLVVLIFDPFSGSSNVDEESNEEETVEEEVTIEEDTLRTKEDGEISLTDLEVSSLIGEITFENNEYYDNDTISLFNNSSNAINSLTDVNKLLLMSKTSDFNTLINTKVVNGSICDSSVEIDVTDVNTILYNRFNTTLVNYENFIYSYYVDGSFISNIKFTYDKTTNKYLGSCYDISSSVTNLAEVEVYKAKKSGDYLYLYSYVVFINETGVYKDTNFKTLITNDENATSSDYMNGGNTYIYTFNISGDNYYLESINLSS